MASASAPVRPISNVVKTEVGRRPIVDSGGDALNASTIESARRACDASAAFAGSLSIRFVAGGGAHNPPPPHSFYVFGQLTWRRGSPAPGCFSHPINAGGGDRAAARPGRRG